MMKTLVWIAILTLLLSACTNNAKLPHGPRPNPVTQAPDDEKDSGPAVPPDLSHVTEPTPRTEPKSRYGNPPSYHVMGRTYRVLDSADGFKERGIASWYGNKFHGRRTSSGEPYDMYKMTAAHKTLPIPVHVRVTNLDNGKSIVVRVNDRGPFVDGRIIDLSYAAAHKLGMANIGTARVEITALNGESTVGTSTANDRPIAAVGGVGSGDYFVQVASFSRREGAEKVAKDLQPLVGHPIKVERAEVNDDSVYRVQIGPLTRREYAESVQAHLHGKGYSGTTIIMR